jgi:hypothetical protein
LKEPSNLIFAEGAKMELAASIRFLIERICFLMALRADSLCLFVFFSPITAGHAIPNRELT